MKKNPDLLKKIHVTEVGGCTRRSQMSYNGRSALPSHYHASRGIMAHRALQRLSEGSSTLLQYKDLSNLDKKRIPKDIFEKIIPEITDIAGKWGKWLEDSKLDLSKFKLEHTIELSMENEFILSGTPDAYNDEWVLDYKTGSRQMSDHVTQIAVYASMLENIDEIKRRAQLIYLGNSSPKVAIPDHKTLEKKVEEFRTMLDAEIESRQRILDGWEGECKVGFMCIYCPYKGECVGI